MTLEQASGHSLAQLELMAGAARRLEARRALLNLDSTVHAVASVWCKEGGGGMKKLRDLLEKQSYGQ